MRHHWLSFAVFVVAATVPAAAQVTTQERGSIVVFPKVVADATWDTTIQLGGAVNHPVYARCFYINAAPADPSLPVGTLNPASWAQTDFAIKLERQQPTHWVASRGRGIDPDDAVCDATHDRCDGAGFDPGMIPPLPAGFVGELRCIELDASGAPWSGNGLRGQATLTHLATGEVVKYPAAVLRGLAANDADGNLCLGGAPTATCPAGAEYGGCPESWIVSHPSDYDLRASDGDARSTRFTIAPCAADLLTQVPDRLVVRFSITNEFEQNFLAATTIDCWADYAASDFTAVLGRQFLGADWVQTQIHSENDSGGIFVVQQTERATARPALFAASATVPQQQGSRAAPDVIRLPQESP